MLQRPRSSACLTTSGKRVAAAVVTRAQADPAEIAGFSRQLAPASSARVVEIWADLPVSPVGKSLRREVRDRMIAARDE